MRKPPSGDLYPGQQNTEKNPPKLNIDMWYTPQFLGSLKSVYRAATRSARPTYTQFVTDLIAEKWNGIAWDGIALRKKGAKIIFLYVLHAWQIKLYAVASYNNIKWTIQCIKIHIILSITLKIHQYVGRQGFMWEHLCRILPLLPLPLPWTHETLVWYGSSIIVPMPDRWVD